MRVTEIETYRNFLSNLSRLDQKMNAASQQLTTGKKLNSLGDSPSGVAEVIQLNDELARLDQYTSNADTGAFYLNVTDTVLNSIQNLVTSIYTKGSQAATGTATAENQTVLATEIRTLRDQLLGLANSEAKGRYVFAGAQVTRAPFSISGDTVTYNGDSGINRVAVGDSVQIQQNVPGSEAFTQAFDTIGSLLAGLDGQDSSAIKAALGEFAPALAALSDVRGQVGATLSTVEDIKAAQESSKTNIQERIAQVADANIAAAITDLSQFQTSRQAALSAAASLLSQPNLFDILG